MVCITPRGSLRGAVATKQSQSEIATLACCNVCLGEAAPAKEDLSACRCAL